MENDLCNEKHLRSEQYRAAIPPQRSSPRPSKPLSFTARGREAVTRNLGFIQTMILVRLLKNLQELRHRWIWAEGAGFGNCSPFCSFPFSYSPGEGCSAVPSHRPAQLFCFTSARPPSKRKGSTGMSNSSPKVRDTIHTNITFQRVFIHSSWNQINLISVFCCCSRQMTVT